MYRKKEQFVVAIEELPRMKKIIEATLSQWGVGEDDLRDIILACDEAATNIILHAYSHKEETEKKKEHFEVNLRKRGRVIEIVMRDRGNSFDVANVPPPDIRENLMGRRKGGFGIHLMRTLMSRIRYHCREGENKTILLKVLSS